MNTMPAEPWRSSSLIFISYVKTEASRERLTNLPMCHAVLLLRQKQISSLLPEKSSRVDESGVSVWYRLAGCQASGGLLHLSIGFLISKIRIMLQYLLRVVARIKQIPSYKSHRLGEGLIHFSYFY